MVFSFRVRRFRLITLILPQLLMLLWLTRRESDAYNLSYVMVNVGLFLQEQLFLIGVGSVVIWLVTLTVLTTQLFLHYRNLTKNITKKDLKSVLEELLREHRLNAKAVKEVEEKLKILEKEGMGHLQKIGFLRFNPFADTGGEQSFILAFLDGEDTGLVFSSLHGRGATRLYAKQVIAGKGKDFELSDEEKKVIQQAKKLR